MYTGGRIRTERRTGCQGPRETSIPLRLDTERRSPATPEVVTDTHVPTPASITAVFASQRFLTAPPYTPRAPPSASEYNLCAPARVRDTAPAGAQRGPGIDGDSRVGGTGGRERTAQIRGAIWATQHDRELGEVEGRRERRGCGLVPGWERA